MSKRNNQWMKSQLALAIAGGSTLKSWAKKNEVPSRTAYTWLQSPEVQEQIERIRSRAMDRAIGRLSKNVTAAADQIAGLAKGAASESVKLSASRAVIADLMSVHTYAVLEKRVAQMEKKMQERRQARFPASRPAQPIPADK